MLTLTIHMVRNNSLLGEGPQKRGPSGCVARSTNKAAIGSTDKERKDNLPLESHEEITRK